MHVVVLFDFNIQIHFQPLVCGFQLFGNGLSFDNLIKNLKLYLSWKGDTEVREAMQASKSYACLETKV